MTLLGSALVRGMRGQAKKISCKANPCLEKWVTASERISYSLRINFYFSENPNNTTKRYLVKRGSSSITNLHYIFYLKAVAIKYICYIFLYNFMLSIPTYALYKGVFFYFHPL